MSLSLPRSRRLFWLAAFGFLPASVLLLAIVNAVYAVPIGGVSIDATASATPADGSVTINVALAGPLAGTVTAQYTTVDGTATSPADYTAQSGTVTFAPGVPDQQITIAITNPGTGPPNKTFTVQLSNVSSPGWLVNSTCTVTIVETPPPTVQFSAANYYACEYSGAATITATLSAASTGTVTVNYATSAGSATPGLDYYDTSGTLTFAPGVISQTFEVTVLPDLLEEGDETVNLTLSSPSGATLGTQSTATLNIWDVPPTLTVTAASNPICAGALPTSIDQSVITVSLTDEYGPIPDVPLTLKTTAGSLSAASGATDYTGSFTTTLTSNHKASGPTKAYRATVSATANGQLTQKTKVELDPPAITLTSDVTKIPPGGTADLTATLTFGGQPVVGHHLLFTVAGVWDAAGNPVTGADQADYGHFKSGVRTTSNDAGIGTAVWRAGYKKGKVEVQVSDTSVEIKPAWTHPDATVSLQEKKPEIAVYDVGSGKMVALDAKNRRFLVGEEVMVELRNIFGKEYKWDVEGFVFKDYTKKEGGKDKRPEGKYDRAVKKDARLLTVCWFTAAKNDKEVKDPPVKATIKITCTVTPFDAKKEPVKVQGELEIYRPTAELLPDFGKMEFTKAKKEKDGVQISVQQTLGLDLAKAEEIGVRINAKAKMPAEFKEAPNEWSYIQLVRRQLILYNGKGDAWSKHSAFTTKSLNGAWVLDASTGAAAQIFNETFSIGKDGKLVNNFPLGHNYFSDWPGFLFTSPLVTPGKPTDGLKRAELENLAGFGALEKAAYYQGKNSKEGQAFKTYLMFKSKRYTAVLGSYPVPIAVYSNWQMSGSAKWDKDKKEYVAEGLNEVAGALAAPVLFEPEWNDREQLGEYKKDN